MIVRRAVRYYLSRFNNILTAVSCWLYRRSEVPWDLSLDAQILSRWRTLLIAIMYWVNA